MSALERLLEETRRERETFLAIPVIQRALSEGVPRKMYLDFLGEAYHHVRHTCRLLSTAVAVAASLLAAKLFRWQPRA